MRNRAATQICRLLAAVSLAASCCATAEADTPPLNVKELLSARSFAQFVPISISRDGKWIAYTVNDNRQTTAKGDERHSVYTTTGVLVRAVGGNIYITNVRTGESRNLTQSKGSSWSPQWSPDGRYLAFFSDRDGIARLWVWEKAAATMRRVSNAIVRPLADKFQWTRDSRMVVLRVLPEGLTIEEAANLMASHPAQGPEITVAEGSKVTIYSSPAKEAVTSNINHTAAGPWSLNRWLGDLALINIRSEQTRRITGIIPADYWISPDGNRLVFSNLKGFVPNSQEMLSDLVTTTTNATNDLRVLLSNVPLPFGSSVSWSPDGKLLAYQTSELLRKGDCFVISLADGKPQNLTASWNVSFGGRRYPLWDAPGRNVLLVGDSALWKASVETETTTLLARIPHREILTVISGPTQGQFWSPDSGASVIVSTRHLETKEAGFYRIDLGTGAFSKLIEESKSYGSFKYEVVVSADQKNVIYLAQDSGHPPDLWTYNFGAANSRQLTSINPELKRYKMGSSRLVEWTRTDGKKLRGALLLPSNYEPGRRYPLIVKVYGGGLGSNSVNDFGLSEATVDNLQLLATRGYAVLYPDCPISPESPLEDLAKMVLPAIDKMVELGIADPKKLGVMGHSFGAYSTMALIVQTTRFKAAVVSAGWANMIGLFGEMSKDGSSYGIPIAQEIGGPPWASPEKYIENSPIFFFDKIKTPVLILHGSADTAVAQFLTDEIFVGLRSLGKEVTYAVYDEEPHWQGSWRGANQVDYANRMINWFDKHLGGEGEARSPVKTSRQ